MDAPKSYKDPIYNLIDQQVESRVGLPAGLLSSVRLHGERSNADQVSSEGARSVYQIIPKTRKSVLKKYGIDAYLSPHNAAMTAALLLKEAQDRNGGNPAEAVAEYVGGTDRKNHGPVTKSYVNRVMSALNPIVTANAAERPEIDPAKILADFQSWKAAKQPEQVQPEQAPAIPQPDQGGSDPNDPAKILADFQAWKAAKQPPQPAKETAIGNPLTLNPYQALSMGAGVINNALSPQDDQPAAEGDRIGQRMARDITDIGQGVINTVSHPLDTAANLAGVIRGGMQSALPDSVTNALIKQGITPDARPQFQAMAQDLKNSYGSPEAILKTAHDRPVSTALNILGLAGGMKSLLNAAPREVATVAPAVDSWTAPGTALERTAAVNANNAARNASAAGASLSEQAAASGINPEITKIIQAGEQNNLLNETATVRHMAAHSLPVPIELTEGQALDDAARMSIEKNSRAKYPQIGERLDQQDAGLHANLDAIHERAAPDIFGGSHIDDGQGVIDGYKLLDNDLKTDIRGKYKALADANGGALPIDTNQFIGAASQELTRTMRGAFLPSKLKKVLVNLQENGVMSFEQFENLRTILASEARKLEIKGDGTALHAVRIVRDALENAPLLPGATQDMKSLADTARAAAKNRFSMLERDPAYKAAVNDKVAADDFIQKFVINGKRKNLETMVEHLADDPLAIQSMNSGVMRALKKAAFSKNGFKADTYRKALNHLEPRLQSIMNPEDLNDLGKVADVGDWIKAQKSSGYVNNSNTFTASLGDKINKGLTHIPGIGPVVEMGLDARLRAIEEQSINNALKPGAGIINNYGL